MPVAASSVQSTSSASSCSSAQDVRAASRTKFPSIYIVARVVQSVLSRDSLLNILAGIIIGNEAAALGAEGLLAIGSELGDFLRRDTLLAAVLVHA